MPLVVDKKKISREIIEAFQKCVREKPITKVTMRDVAEQAGISHPKILYYFKNRDELLIAYAKYMTELYSLFFKEWVERAKADPFLKNEPTEAISKMIEEIAEFDEVKHTGAYEQLYALSLYQPEIAEAIHNAYTEWRKDLREILRELYGREMDDMVNAILVLIEGVLLCTMNGELKNEKVSNLLYLYKQL